MSIEINNCKLIHGDCIDFLKNFDGKADVVITDPPYFYNDYSKGNAGFDESQKNIDFIKNISMGFDVDIVFNLIKKKQEKINIFCFCNDLLLPEIIGWGKKNKKYQVNVLVWEKGGRPFGGTYLHNVEFIVHIRESGSHFGGQYKSRIFKHLSKREWGHPTEKPVILLRKLIEYGSYENDTVLDIFMGSASLGEACIDMNRNFIGVEKDKEIFDLAVKRIKTVSSQGVLAL